MYCAGVRDRSGFNLTYLSTGRKYDAGVLEVGHDVTDDMVVPGRAVSFSIFGECHPSCTSVIFCLLAADHVVLACMVVSSCSQFCYCILYTESAYRRYQCVC